MGSKIVIVNKPGSRKAVVKVLSANTSDTSTIALSDLVASGSGESVSAMNITKALWTGNFTLTRSGTDALYLNDTGMLDFQSFGININENSGASIVVTNTGNANGTCILELSKTSTYFQQ